MPDDDELTVGLEEGARRVNSKPVTPARTAKRQTARPMLVTEALLHLRDRAQIMRGKDQRVWLRWNRADVEAVETVYAAIAAKAPTTEETPMEEYEIIPFAIVVEAESIQEAREIAAEAAQLVMRTAARAKASRNGTRRERLLGRIRRVELTVEPVAA